MPQEPEKPRSSVQRWLILEEFALLYGHNRTTVTRWIQQGKFQSKKIGRFRYVLDPGLIDYSDKYGARTFDNVDRVPTLRGNEVAKIMEISPRRLRMLADEGKIKFQIVGRNRRYSIEDLREFIAYKASREHLPPGSTRAVPKATAKQRRESVIKWAQQRLAQNPALS